MSLENCYISWCVKCTFVTCSVQSVNLQDIWCAHLVVSLHNLICNHTALNLLSDKSKHAWPWKSCLIWPNGGTSKSLWVVTKIIKNYPTGTMNICIKFKAIWIVNVNIQYRSLIWVKWIGNIKRLTNTAILRSHWWQENVNVTRRRQ